MQTLGKTDKVKIRKEEVERHGLPKDWRRQCGKARRVGSLSLSDRAMSGILTTLSCSFFVFKSGMRLGQWGCAPLIPAVREHWQEDLCEFKA